MCRAVVVVIIAAVFPAVILASNSTTISPAAETCVLLTPELDALRSQLKYCWDDIINIFVNETKTPLICHKAADYKHMVERYFRKANETCPKPGNIWSVRSTTILDMLEVTSKNIPIFQKFYEKKCENLVIYTDKCHNTAHSGLKPKNMSWWYRFNLNYKKFTCDVALDMKNCTLAKLEKECPNTVPYVKLMYDVSFKHCPKEPVPPKIDTNTNEKNSAKTTSTAFVMITMPLILAQYLLTY